MTCKVCKWAQHPPCPKRIPCCDCDEECNSRQCEKRKSVLSVKDKGQLVKVLAMLGIPANEAEIDEATFPIKTMQFGPFLSFTFDDMAGVVDYLRDCEKGGSNDPA